MSRPRSTDKSIPISIAIPGSIARILDQKLSYTSSRSAWIVGAIKERLEKSDDESPAPSIRDAPAIQLLVAAMNKIDKHTAEYQMLMTAFEFMRQ